MNTNDAAMNGRRDSLSLAGKEENAEIAITEDGLLHYNVCGLDNIYLEDGFDISPDGKSYSIHNLNSLYECIAMCIIKETFLMSGGELRFIRKELSLTQKSLGDLLGVDAQTVARWEKEETKLDSKADRLVRLEYLFNRVDDDSCDRSIKGVFEAINDMDVQAHHDWLFENNEEWKKKTA
jgi:DNA-binding transcriptional regulator YiaG